ncbi:acyl-CoA carboxylase subunit epsilon [Saccharopolyspora sp. HNM0983]|uniref:Acyl-CoA carboxylase subunit epsilon n=1 Tax=Saccharopolyspora montiporae TaxID=2781240 RepID=A0A929BB20_9PSEU|nr:acyl-CoA carboxylase epsilon subunit [Saccharopolyspora sp. HNM0983]MBE9376579.1 acyl-CoA carboxylase subunit epsilon [Saccharopolyspora sp. HNM0983]
MSQDDGPAPQPDERPVLRVVRGEPDEAEIAALTTALTAAAASAAAQEPAAPPRMSVWADREAGLRHPAGRRPLRPGRHAWRASGLPG